MSPKSGSVAKPHLANATGVENFVKFNVIKTMLINLISVLMYLKIL